jgi:hypothetical protein
MFSVKLVGLKDYTTYFYRAYVRLNGKYYYGEVREFQTKMDFTGQWVCVQEAHFEFSTDGWEGSEITTIGGEYPNIWFKYIIDRKKPGTNYFFYFEEYCNNSGYGWINKGYDSLNPYWEDIVHVPEPCYTDPETNVFLSKLAICTNGKGYSSSYLNWGGPFISLHDDNKTVTIHRRQEGGKETDREGNIAIDSGSLIISYNYTYNVDALPTYPAYTVTGRRILYFVPYTKNDSAFDGFCE